MPCSKCAWLSNAEGGAEYAATAELLHEQSQSLCSLLELVGMVRGAIPETQPHALLCKTSANCRAVTTFSSKYPLAWGMLQTLLGCDQ